MTESDLPGMAQLRATQGVLRGLVCAMTAEEAAWKPSPKRWSVLEVLGHLIHVESVGFRGRIERLMQAENPRIDPYDPDAFAAAGVYGGRTLGLALAEFETERQHSLAVLEALPAAAFSRTGVHRELGPVTIENLLNEWPLHDLGHIRQIAELVRAVKYHPHIGPWRKSYPMNP